MSVLSFLKTAARDVEHVGGSTLHFLSDALIPGKQIYENTRDQIQQNTQRAVSALPARPQAQIEATPEYNAVRNAPNPYTGAQNFAKSTGQAIARSGLSTGLSLGVKPQQAAHGAELSSLQQLKALSVDARKQAVKNNPGLKQVLDKYGIDENNIDDATIDKGIQGIQTAKSPELQVTNPVAKAVLGPEPVKTLEARQKGATTALEGHGLPSTVAGPLAFLGVGATEALNVAGGGGEKAAGKELLDQLAKEVSDQGIKKLLKDKLAPDVLNRVAPAIAQTKDPNVIRNILAKSTQPAAPAIINDISNPARLGQEAAPVQDLRAATIPTPAATPPTDPFEEILGAVHGSPATKGQAGQKGLVAARAEQDALLAKERGQRFAASGAAGKTAEGSQGYYAEKNALQGEYGKVAFTPLVHDIGPDRAEELFSSARQKIQATPDSVYENLDLHPGGARLNTQTAVRKVLGLEPGLPTKSEIKLLGIHSPQLAEEAKAAIPRGRKIFDAAATLFGNARSAKSTLDLSMGGRQGLFVAGRHPKEWAAANAESVRYALDKNYYQSEMKAIHGDEWGKLIDSHNPSVLTGGASHEEQYANTDIVGKVPGVQASERAYTGGLTKLRKDILTSRLQAYGATPEEVVKNLGDKGISGLIEAVSTLTGRGGKAGGWVEKHATTLQEALFSPRLWASRLAPLNPAFWKRIGPAGRKEAIQSLGSFAAVASVVLGAAVAAGAEVETDPRSSDFLKVKVGDTRYDILGGFQQNLVFGARQALGLTNTISDAATPGDKSGTNFKTYKSSTSGKLSQFGDGSMAPNQLTSAFDLVRNKANPVIAAGANIIEGKDKAGNRVNPLTEIGQLFVPINIQQAFNARSNPKDVLKGLPDIVGIGSQTYGIKDVNISDKQKQTVAKLKDKTQQAAYTRFYQTVKTGPDRTKAGDSIKVALKANDTAKAKQLATEYNKKYADSFGEWRKQYGQYSDKTLLKEYNSNKITSETLKRYVTSIKKGE